MPHIIREDGEYFIIPSYREVLSAKKKGLLKREILLLASNYGEYIMLQKKSLTQYEVAFSSEPGALLGETVWHYFKRPRDLIYCEEVPNTNEAILVIVKSGSVYLDGSFPKDTIADELVVFQTQKNNFEIYLYGNVPISETEEEGKFTFDSSSVKSITLLKKPLFPVLPVVRQFQLQWVDVALKNEGIGVFPTRNIIIGLVAVGLIWMAWEYLTTTTKEQLPQVLVSVVNPYQSYYIQLASPDPLFELQKLSYDIMLFYTVPGWVPNSFTYAGGNLRVSMKSLGARTNLLFDWAKRNRSTVVIASDGFYLNRSLALLYRQPSSVIYALQNVIGTLIDRLSFVLPGNPLTIGKFVNKGKFNTISLSIEFQAITPTTLNLISQQFRQLPLILNNVSITAASDTLTGKIDLTALGT